MMRALFRFPIFPVVYKTGTITACATNVAELESYLELNASTMPAQCELIDSRWEKWVLFPKEAFFSPLTVKNRYTKREFLLFCGVSKPRVSAMNLDRFPREEIFAIGLKQTQRQAKKAAQSDARVADDLE